TQKREMNMADRQDHILVEQSQAGYSEAFGLLVKKYQRKIYEISYHFTHNVDEADELSQEIFLKAYPFFTQLRELIHLLYLVIPNCS
ncbi:MAG: sigma factor, partial [Candidatus Poribacteria bacterium]|nr:sigma factor [Candidatus Poribacteria bacterium]